MRREVFVSFVNSGGLRSMAMDNMQHELYTALGRESYKYRDGADVSGVREWRQRMTSGRFNKCGPPLARRCHFLVSINYFIAHTVITTIRTQSKKQKGKASYYMYTEPI